jgi:ParB family chromosome partitioning protein
VPEPARGMGRGLAAILSVSPPSGDGEPAGSLRTVPIDAITPNPRQPRASIEPEALDALSSSLKERGVLQPIIVRPTDGPGNERFELIAGERRWRAAQMAGLEDVPALVREADDAASLEIALIENMAREDLNPVDQARACAALVEELNLTREAVGRRVGRSRVSVSNLIRLLDLPQESLEALEAGRLTEGHGRALLLADDHDRRRKLTKSAVEAGWSVRELERRAREETVPVAAHRRVKTPEHPDRAAAFERLADSFGSALGAETTVRAKGDGCQVQVAFDSLDAAYAALGRLGGRDAA